MPRPFDAFVIFAEMRTGSNHLEESLGTLPDVTCHGEVFNPGFVGQHNRAELFGITLASREKDPLPLLHAMTQTRDTLSGFRFFHDHDPRVLAPILDNPRMGKVILHRNPLEAYVSRKIARATDQWRLTDLKQAKTQRINFDELEFNEMVSAWGSFQTEIRRKLQATGQTAFHIGYDDINDAAILTGLARFIGSSNGIERASTRLKRQNPAPLRDKVANYEAMQGALSRIDPFGLELEPSFEAPRGPGVPHFVAHPAARLLFIPVAGAPHGSVLDWMAGVGGVGRHALLTGMRQKDLRKWLRTHPGFVSFTVLRHPARRVAAAYAALAETPEIADVLSHRYGVHVSDTPGAADVSAFCDFLKGALAGQTSLRLEPGWATQTALLQGVAQVLLPQQIIKEDGAAHALSDLAHALGLEGPAYVPEPAPETSAPMDAVTVAYRRDFVQFGFEGDL